MKHSQPARVAAAAASPASATAAAPSPARSAAAQLVLPQIEKLYREVGKQVVDIYLRERTTEQMLSLTSAELRRVIEQALARDTAAVRTLGTSRLPLESQARLDILSTAVREAPTLDGISIQNATELVARRLSAPEIKPGAMREFLRRTQPYHQLTVRRGRVRFQADVVMEILAKQRRQSGTGVGERGDS